MSCLTPVNCRRRWKTQVDIVPSLVLTSRYSTVSNISVSPSLSRRSIERRGGGSGGGGSGVDATIVLSTSSSSSSSSTVTTAAAATSSSTTDIRRPTTSSPNDLRGGNGGGGDGGGSGNRASPRRLERRRIGGWRSWMHSSRSWSAVAVTFKRSCNRRAHRCKKFSDDEARGSGTGGWWPSAQKCPESSHSLRISGRRSMISRPSVAAHTVGRAARQLTDRRRRQRFRTNLVFFFFFYSLPSLCMCPHTWIIIIVVAYAIKTGLHSRHVLRTYRPDFLARRCPDTPVFFCRLDHRLLSHNVIVTGRSCHRSRGTAKKLVGRPARTKIVEKSRPGYEEIFQNTQYTCMYILLQIPYVLEAGAVKREKIILQQNGGCWFVAKTRRQHSALRDRSTTNGSRSTDCWYVAREHLISNRSRNVFTLQRAIARNKFPRITRLLNVSSRTLE